MDIDFTAPLADAWMLGDPLALRRESGSLAFATASKGVVASLPVELSPELLDLTVALSVDESEWSARLDILLAPESVPHFDGRR